VSEKPKVVYVMGTGRSGSTVLGLALGNCEGIVCGGELHLWLARGGRSPLRGEERTRFWAQVREQVQVEEDLIGTATRALEQSSAVLRPGTWRRQRRLRARYRRATEQILRATASTAGATHVVDTSHFPRRARELQTLEGIELYVLFVVRDAQGIVASYRHDERDFPHFKLLGTNAYVWLTYLLSLLVFLRQPRERRLLVRYEQFVAEPETALREILGFVGAPAELPDLDALRTGVAFQGNRLLSEDVVALKRGWPRAPRDSRLTALLQLPWSAVFSRLRPAAGRGGEASARAGS
jgi:hypothetical protein